jgi:hypothetical protein
MSNDKDIEALEQARIIGMGAERELALMAKLAKALSLLNERSSVAVYGEALVVDYVRDEEVHAFLKEAGHE